MRNVLLFILRSYYMLLFLLLEGFCIYLLVINNRYHNATFLNSANSVAASIYTKVQNVRDYFSLRKNNLILQQENALLRQKLVSNYYELKAKSTSFSDTLYKQNYTFITAKVINNSVNHRSNYLTLDKGSLQGVSPDMGVITNNGVVGIVKDVSPHYCSVLSLLHKDTKISARLAQSRYFGSMIWEGGNPKLATLTDIPRHVQLKKGMKIETTSFSSLYPEGIELGIIVEWEVKPGENFYSIQVLLSNDFQNLTHVYIVNNLFKAEKDTIEANSQSNDQ